jgi:ABC-2 type transport system ATP-binding protein
MIESVDLTKRFDDVTAVDHVNAVIAEGSVFGLVGTNGAGKSTFLRLVTGILKPDEGRVLIDGEDVFTVPRIREQFFYVPDDQYFFSNVTPREMMAFFAKIYPHFDRGRFGRLAGAFELPENRKINTFSKGMKKQLSIILGLSAGTKYLLCDETFDGLDPVMRQAVKSLFAEDMTERGLTPVITSHNLRELEDICDHVGLLHKGGILFSRDLDDMKLNIHKLQCVLKPDMTANDLAAYLTDPLNVLRIEQRGSILTLTVRGSEYELLGRMEQLDTVFYEVVPLSLEEIFISETEVTGYDIKKLLF